METKIATNENQSKKLIELGINIDTADMHYSKWDNDEEEEYHLKCGGFPKLDFKYSKNIPAWSLSKLLELMPYPSLHNFFNDEWRCDIHYEDGDVRKFGEDADSPLDAAFEMMCYLLENKLIK